MVKVWAPFRACWLEKMAAESLASAHTRFACSAKFFSDGSDVPKFFMRKVMAHAMDGKLVELIFMGLKKVHANLLS